MDTELVPSEQDDYTQLSSSNGAESESRDCEYAYLSALLNDTLIVPLGETGLCLNHDLDSLTAETAV